MARNKNIYDENEVRSKKVREIIGAIPISLVYWGIAVVVIILAVLAAVMLLFPYPYSHGETIFQHIVN